MTKNQKRVQISLILIGVFLIFVTYFYYPYISKTKLITEQPLKDDLEKTQDQGESTFFKNVEYKGYYDLNKPFTIKSEEAQILSETPDIIYMKNMHLILYLSDGRIVNITSDQGQYNKLTYDCFFKKNVFANDGETQISAENLDLLATENSVKIYDSVNLNYPEGSLRADNVDYDFETKYFKVSMFNEEDIKIKLIK